ncbi:hypothetical protein BJ878DRAFT_522532 [Calycina marina]|uniref:C2H2-type domain-containing protein n=1 Tax=Calycina marina TaxID=1763456 RepID=A0A9P8CBY8_9HELO|nr:hypothetical protein BJ878DRAFT_522532 [Calycina marina]
MSLLENSGSLECGNTANCRCRWGTCYEQCSNGEALFKHLCEQHIGRTATNNLDPICKWLQCKIRTRKREHMTSHILVHISFQSYVCFQCTKTFKRLGDVKKHELTHDDKSTLSTFQTTQKRRRVAKPLHCRSGSAFDKLASRPISSPTNNDTPCCRTAISNTTPPPQYTSQSGFQQDTRPPPQRHSYAILSIQNIVVQSILVKGLLATDYMQIESDIIESQVRPLLDLPMSRN